MDPGHSADRRVDRRSVRFSPSRRPPAFLAGDAAQEEHHVGRAFSQAAHEVRVPLATIGHVDPDPIARLDELLLQVAPDAVEHLELELVTAQPLPDRKSTRLNSSHANISYAVFCLKE